MVMHIILFGIQGSGKGTQAQLLSKRFSWTHVNIGEVFRHHIEEETELGEIAQKYIHDGNFVPDDLVFMLLKEVLQCNSDGFILDGFPRNVHQGHYLLENYSIDKVIKLKLDEEKAVQRISARRICKNCKSDFNLLMKKPKKEGICDQCGGELVQRKDDKPQAIKKRLEKYYQETKPVIELIKSKMPVYEIDADDTPQSIHEKIVEYLQVK
jgi:adenylate kinase